MHLINLEIKKELTYCENFIENNTIAPTEKKKESIKKQKQELRHSQTSSKYESEYMKIHAFELRKKE